MELFTFQLQLQLQLQLQQQQQMSFPVQISSTQSASCSIFPLLSSQQFQSLLLCQAETSTFRSSPVASRNRRLNASSRPVTKYSKWDSNVERMSWKGSEDGDEGKTRDKRRWWSVEFDLPDENDDQNVGFLDSIWIFKAFRSYGWTLPVVVLSLLLATGPKAFLISLALCIGQSALSLALNKLSAAIRANTRRRRRKPKRK